jgi:RNA polymerase sigma factor for flagellar operon FliA
VRSGATNLLRTAEERDRLIEQYLPLVRYVVARLPVTMPATLDRDDFYSVGVMGLMQAATTYDPTRGASFKTFAYTAIRGAILDEVRKHDPVPRNRRDRLRRIERATTAFQAQFDRPPSPQEIATAVGCTLQDLDDDFQALHTARMLSLDEVCGNDEDDGSTFGATLANHKARDPGEKLDNRDAVDRLAKAVAELPEADRHVVVLYYYEKLFLKEIGQILGVTESRVSQILSRAVERLRLRMKGDEE